MISWNQVVKCFEQSDAKVLRNSNPLDEYWNKCNVYKNAVADDQAILYVVDVDSMQHAVFENHVSVVILNHNSSSLDDIPEGIGNALCVNAQDNEENGVTQLERKFFYQLKMGYLLSSVQDAIVNDLGTHAIVELISQFLDEPVALLDTSLHFIDKSLSHKPDYSKSRFPEAHDKESFDENVIMFLKKLGVLEKMINSTEPACFKMEGEGACYIPVMMSGIKVAYLVVYSNSPEKWKIEDYYDHFPLLVKALSIEMSKGNFYLLNKGYYYNYIFSILLSEQAVELEDIKLRLKVNDYDLRDNMYLIEIDTELYKNVSIHKDRIADSFRRLFRNSFFVFKDDKIYFLVSRSDHDLVTQREIDLWEQTLKSQKLIAAVTGPFQSFLKMKQHLREVELVLQAQRYWREKGPLFFFEQFQTKAMLSSLRSKEDIGLFKFQPVLDLAEYDRAHGTELILTLKEYLNHPKGIHEICDTLCIHKNTLYKRLDKIQSILKCDYTSGENVMKIELTFEMMQMDGEAHSYTPEP